MSDTEGKAPREEVTEPGSEEISIMNEELKQHALLPAAVAGIVSR